MSDLDAVQQVKLATFDEVMEKFITLRVSQGYTEMQAIEEFEHNLFMLSLRVAGLVFAKARRELGKTNAMPH